MYVCKYACMHVLTFTILRILSFEPFLEEAIGAVQQQLQ